MREAPRRAARAAGPCARDHRTHRGAQGGGRGGAVERARAYAATGVDALFVTGLETLDEFDAIRAAVKLPIIVGRAPALKREDLEPRGVRLVLQGHQPVAAAVKALRDVYTQLYKGTAPAELKSLIATPQEMDELVNGTQYRAWLQQYLH